MTFQKGCWFIHSLDDMFHAGPHEMPQSIRRLQQPPSPMPQGHDLLQSQPHSGLNRGQGRRD